MSEIQFSKEEKEILTQRLKSYLGEELDVEVGQFECEFFLDFISAQLGGFYYNKGLADAQVIIANKMEDISDALYEVEKPTGFARE